MVLNPAPPFETAAWPLEATFDGGARWVQGRWVAGAGASLWHHPPEGGAPVCIATAVAAVPRGATAQVAEAMGCRMALAMLARTAPTTRAARLVGDSTGVVRYGAGTGRLSRPEMQAHLDGPLADLAEAGWRLTWQAVRRRLNATADRLAGEGEQMAARLAQEGTWRVQTRVRWSPAAARVLPAPGGAPPAAAPSAAPASGPRRAGGVDTDSGQEATAGGGRR